MASLYLVFLMVTLLCMVLCDYRWKLAFFAYPARAGVLSAVVVAAFLLWDVLGIATGTFFRGDADYMTGIVLGPEMPIEEPVFLFFLCYLLLNLISAARAWFADHDVKAEAAYSGTPTARTDRMHPNPRKERLS